MATWIKLNKGDVKLPPLIGIAGDMGSGKDTIGLLLAKFIRKYTGKEYKLIKFATALRHVLAVFTGLTVEFMETAEGKKHYLPRWDRTVGQLLQTLGTDAIRDHFHQEAWVLALFADEENSQARIITDVRFPNEVESITGRGGVVIRIIRAAVPPPDGRSTTHSSENGCYSYWGSKQPFAVVYNHGSLEDLEKNIIERLLPPLGINKDIYSC